VTTYFDQKAREVRQLFHQATEPSRSQEDILRDFEWALYKDMSMVCEFDQPDGPVAFPPELRNLVYLVLLRRCLTVWPHGVLFIEGIGVDYETAEEGRQHLSQAVEDLHDIFHDAARRGWCGGDNPLSALGAATCRAETKMVELVEIERVARGGK